MNKYRVTRSLRHNGVVYEIDEQVELTKSEAKRLASLGAIAKAVSVPPSQPPAEGNTIGDQIVALFKQWQGDGEKLAKKPNVDSVRDALDNQDITTDQRDEAWERYQSEGSD